MKPDTISNIQVLRFLAAAGVMTKHALWTSFGEEFPLRWFPWQAGVDIFFVVSGFIMAWLSRDCFGQAGAAPRFLLRRAIRIVPSYWLFTLLLAGVLLVAPHAAPGTHFDPALLAASLAFIPWPRPDSGELYPLLSLGWTLNFEMFFYLCFGAALLARPGKGLLIALLCGLALAGIVARPQSFLASFYTDSILLEFVAGTLIQSLYHRGLRLRWWAIAGLLAAAILYYGLLHAVDWLWAYRILMPGLPAIMIAAAFILAPEPAKHGPLRRFLTLGGDSSYTLYLSHPFTIGAVALGFAAAGTRSPGLTAATAIALSMGFAIAFYLAVERPVTDGLQRRAGLRRVDEVDRVAP